VSQQTFVVFAARKAGSRTWGWRSPEPGWPTRFHSSSDRNQHGQGIRAGV